MPPAGSPSGRFAMFPPGSASAELVRCFDLGDLRKLEDGDRSTSFREGIRAFGGPSALSAGSPAPADEAGSPALLCEELSDGRPCPCQWILIYSILALFLQSKYYLPMGSLPRIAMTIRPTSMRCCVAFFQGRILRDLRIGV
eukprot:8194009-Pyramimonas_sp.AAC.1